MSPYRCLIILLCLLDSWKICATVPKTPDTHGSVYPVLCEDVSQQPVNVNVQDEVKANVLIRPQKYIQEVLLD